MLLVPRFAIPLCAIAVAALLPTDASEPFGVRTTPVVGGWYAEHWPQLQADMRADAVTVALCRTAPDTCSPAALRFIAIVDEASLQDGVARIGHLNRAVNLAITLKRQDFPVWRSPLAVLAGQEGDCKASAVVKYVALGDLGVGDRRIVTVHVKSLNEEHAVVAVRGGIGWLILDNRTMSLVDSDAEPEYEPVLELDENGVREFISPNPRLGGLPCTNAAMFAEGAP